MVWGSEHSARAGRHAGCFAVFVLSRGAGEPGRLGYPGCSEAGLPGLLAGIGGGAADAAVKLAQELRVVVRALGDAPPAPGLLGAPDGVAGNGGIGVRG